MEAKIKAKFSDWTAVGPAGADPNLGKVAERKTQAKVVVQPGTALNMQLTWVRPPDLRQDTLAKRRGDMILQLGFAGLNRRLSAMSREATPPFLAAAAFQADQGHSAE